MLKKLGVSVFVAACFIPVGQAGSPRGHIPNIARSVHRMRPQNQSPAGTLPGQSKTLMPDGRILLLGGEGPNGPSNMVALQDAVSGSITTLPATLLHSRAWHSATLLPDGTILILGGQGANGAVVKEGELFDPSTLKFQSLTLNGVVSRIYHTATLLTDGHVLIAGGAGSGGETLRKLELWDYRSRTGTPAPIDLLTPRSKHTATLLPDGTVLVWGGKDGTGSTLSYGEIFDPVSQGVWMQAVPINPPAGSDTPSIATSIPENGDNEVAVDSIIALRFSKPLKVETVNTSTVVLSSSEGAVAAKVIPAEAGMLAFVSPQGVLAAGTAYTLSLEGLTDDTGQPLPDSQILFTTAGTNDSSGVVATGGGTSSGVESGDPLNSPFRNLPPLQAKPGVTALAGQVLGLDGDPIAQITLEMEGGGSTRTDRTGRFLLTGINAGHIVMWIDGTSANTPKKSYGIFEVGVDIVGGQTNVLNYTVWMPLLDMAHAVTIPSPTQTEVVVTTPALPGLELHIPPQTTILDRKGNVVTQVSITPVPVKQPPFPLPKDVLVPLYFTIQPGGAYIQVANASGPQGAQLYYPNTYHYPSGAVFNFYNYDADNKGWYVYGQGRVSAGRSQVIPNAGVAIYEFTGAMVSNPSNAPPNGPTPGNNPKRGDPLDLQTGLFVYSKTDLALSDTTPLVLTRTYRPNDYISRAFGIGTNHNYDMFMVGPNDGGPFPAGYTYQDVILADGGRIHFTRTSPCVGSNGFCDFSDAVLTATSTTTGFYGATIRWNSCGFSGASWCLKKKDGTVYGFPDSTNSTVPQAAAPLGMRDRYGNTVTFTRDANHNLTQITSPNGRWIQFTYDSSNRVTEAQDNIGRTVIYNYDPQGRLSMVTDANGGLWAYTYDVNNNMLAIQDPRNIVYLTNYYDSNNRVYKQVQADNGTYLYSYILDQNGNVTQTNVIDPRGFQEQAVFNSDGFMTSDTFAVGRPEQQTITYNRQPGSGLVQSVTDALGRQTTFSYDNVGNTTSVTRLAGTQNAVTTQLAYESTFNQLTAVTDPLGHTTSFTHDGNGNLIAVTDPLGNTTSMRFNPAGQPTSVTDSLGNTMQFAYDSGDLVGITDPLGRTVIRFVDSAGRLASITDPQGRITKYTYNALNQVTKVTDPKGNSTNFGFDPNGNLLSVTDANNHQTQYTYDNMDRVQTRTDALLNVQCYGTFSGSVCQSNGYDGNGNLVQFTDRRGKIVKFSYDGLDRVTFAGFGWTTGTNYESTVNYTYDAGNRPRTAVDSLTGTITRGYDDLDRLTSDATPQGTVTYTYDNAGRRASLTVTGQSVVNYTFDNGNRLTQIAQGTTTVGFTYDNANRRATLTLPNGVVTSYSYDTASQLTGMTYALGSNLLGSLSYGYDNDGRRSSATGTFARTGLPLAMNQTAYNANNQLTTWGTANLFYDLNGNMTSDGTHSYTWDARNRLTQIDSGNTASFSYDPFGRRTSKTVLSTQTGFVYDSANPVQELSGTTVTANSLSVGVDEVFQRSDSAGARSFITDALGSSLALMDSSGTAQTSYTYEPFGNTTMTGAATTSSFAYTGREIDATGLYYDRARYYHPTFQRFISEDPLGFGGGDENLYAYAWDSPTNFIDPVGQFAWPRHVEISNNAQLLAGLTVDPSFSQQVAAVDLRDGSQGTDADATNTHAMSGMTTGRKPHAQSPCEAYQGTVDQIAQDAKNGDLTKALHTIQDAYSPSHYGFQFWDGGWGWFHIPSPGHMKGDFFPPQSAIDGATAASAQFLRDITENPNGPIDPRRYLPMNPCPQ